jgi:hypothetical protein
MRAIGLKRRCFIRSSTTTTLTSWQLDAQGRTLPKLVHREFDDYLKCGRLEHGFLRVRCSDCHAEKLLAFSCKRLERRELLVRDAENSHLDFEPSAEGDGLADLQSHSITYRIALGAQRRRKAFTLQSLPPAAAADSTDRVAQCAGFSLHAGVAAEDSQREKLERLCRYISRPAVSIERLSRLADGRIR